ncbi:MAG TPA: nitroreductase family protein [Longimicrobiales bacterium]|nr:nitroreductase family protein [Longimicrobiales bacterium]
MRARPARGPPMAAGNDSCEPPDGGASIPPRNRGGSMPRSQDEDEVDRARAPGSPWRRWRSRRPEGTALPRGFSRHEVRDEELRIVLEAARCAPSSFNEQPWRFLVAKRDDPFAFEQMRSCLTARSAWVESAPVLLLVGVRTRFARTGRVNEHAHAEVSRAMGRLIARAMMIELYVHRVGAVRRDRAHELFGIPDDVAVVDAAAIGFPRDAEPLSPGELAQLAVEACARPRRPLDELVFEREWGSAARFVETLRHGSD